MKFQTILFLLSAPLALASPAPAPTNQTLPHPAPSVQNATLPLPTNLTTAITHIKHAEQEIGKALQDLHKVEYQVLGLKPSQIEGVLKHRNATENVDVLRGLGLGLSEYEIDAVSRIEGAWGRVYELVPFLNEEILVGLGMSEEEIERVKPLGK